MATDTPTAHRTAAALAEGAPGHAGPAVDAALAIVRDTLEEVFAAVESTRAATAELFRRAADGRSPAVAELAALRPLLLAQLAAHAPLISGAGFVAEPGSLADAPSWLEWWQPGPNGTPQPLRQHLDPDRSALADYTHWDWFAIPRSTGRRAVSGPYVDYLCSDEYSLTLAAPVEVDGVFRGVAAADVYLRHFEAAVLPALRRIGAPACLVNAKGRVAASTSARHLAGSLLRSPDPATHTLLPCGSVPLTLVVTG
ncbi:cache domain-containing protein [Kitasatospora sp. NPDC059571]|uniref:cache domain-containing protein n=1 Tax=Kitasatospora sp. NPDC059571 TaxID=3346871 RepID=UPI00367B4CB5